MQVSLFIFPKIIGNLSSSVGKGAPKALKG